jgi:hypothetical protein
MASEFVTARRNHHLTILATGVKVCNRCGESKPLSEFVKQSKAKGGVGAYCLPCWRVYIQQWDAANPVKRRRSHIRSRYGITPEQRSELLEGQDGLCAACYEEPATDIDHDHRTGQVRGLLCRDCNLALGHLKDDPERIALLAAYLEGQ